MYVFLQEIGAAAIMTKEEDLCRLFTFPTIFYNKVLDSNHKPGLPVDTFIQNFQSTGSGRGGGGGTEET